MTGLYLLVNTCSYMYLSPATFKTTTNADYNYGYKNWSVWNLSKSIASHKIFKDIIEIIETHDCYSFIHKNMILCF